MSDAVDAPDEAASPAPPRQPVAFGFNLGKVPGQGEDSDPILRAGREAALVAVFDGMGGAGGTVYETPDGPRTGAYLAARVAREVVERRMVDLMQPGWPLQGPQVADDLARSVKEALEAALEELHAPKSGLRSKLLRALPTTMALVALQHAAAGGDRWVAHVLWAGDSRAYVLDASGVHQLTTDDLRDPGDALANLRHDSVVGNAMSADTDFHVNHRQVELQAPFVVIGATDGCYGYVRSPMHFEHMLLEHLAAAEDVASWSAAVQRDIAAVTGDDAAMSLLAVGAELHELQALLEPRRRELEERHVRPVDEAFDAVTAAEAALVAARRTAEERLVEAWGRYKAPYEVHLRDDGGSVEGSGARDVGDHLRDLWSDATAAAPADEEER